MELLEDFTNSRDKLHHEIDEMTSDLAGAELLRGPRRAATTAGIWATRNGSGGGTQLYDAIYLASDELMKPQSGRKALVVFSDGADRGSKETLNDAVDAADRANLQVFTIYFKGEEERQQNGMPGGGQHGGMGGGWPGVGAAIPAGRWGRYRGGRGGQRGPASEQELRQEDHAADCPTDRRPVL